MSKLDSEAIWRDLRQRGYCVIPNVIPYNKCDELSQELKSWALAHDNGELFKQPHSLTDAPRIGHLEAAWKARLLVKDVFAAVWGTDKLVSSFDKLSICPPPEISTGDFDTGFSWLHVDRSGYRRGLHAFQGGIYLEETTETDACLRIMEGSSKYTDDFFSTHPEATKTSYDKEHYRLSEDEIAWYSSKGCFRKLVPAPKGSVVLWDTRTVHDTVKPKKGRPHADRWRYVVLACMLPAIWASDADLEFKRKAFENMSLTCHMPCLKVRTHEFSEDIPESLYAIQRMPDITKTPEVLRLVGIEKYDFHDGKPNGPTEKPKWTEENIKFYDN
ncbi:hypothetical protein SNE40_013901 [Patella caerulea]|uniref:Phytanoyl-CoA dioxygenase n=1 Tax=Patella caerulea TaxID=87958 RepID=A0AAN8PPM4_PATCE